MDDEVELYKKYGLFWFQACIPDPDSPNDFLAEGFYIQMPERFSKCFWTLFDRLGQVNDYCFQMLLASESKLNELKNERIDLASNIKPSVCASQFDYFDDQIPNWTHNVNIISKSSTLVILASFVEWGLKIITEELKLKISKEDFRNKSKIDAYIFLLQRTLFNDLVIPREIQEILTSFKKSRNQFAHGDWDDLESTIYLIDLREAFEAVSELFIIIEKKTWMTVWK